MESKQWEGKQVFCNISPLLLSLFLCSHFQPIFPFSCSCCSLQEGLVDMCSSLELHISPVVLASVVFQT